jgi:hypothetical protein
LRMKIDPIFDDAITWALMGAIALIVVFSLTGLRGKVTDKTRHLLAALKIGAGAGLCMLLLKPHWLKKEEDPAAFKVVVLADLSASMLTRDAKDQPPRIENLRNALENPEKSWLKDLRDKWRVETLAFAKQLFPLASGSWDTVSQQTTTGIGDALRQVLQQDGDPVGAVMLLTDGKDNAGMDVSSIVSLYKEAGVPINIIGMGDHRPSGDLEVKFDKDEIEGVAREEMEITATVKNHFNHSVQTTATLLDGEKVLARKPVNLERNSEETIRFSYIRETAGARNIRIKLDSPSTDTNPSTDSDFAVALVKAPEEFRLLYLSNRMNLNYRFIKKVLAPEERVQFHSLVQLSEDKFLPFGKDIPSKWPEKPEFFNQFDVLILDTTLLSVWPEPLVKGVVDFVSLRGGGLLLFGPTDLAREKMSGLLPVSETEVVFHREDRQIQMDAQPIFGTEEDVDALKFFLPGKLPANLATKLKIAARNAATLQAAGGSALALQSYGAGKCAYWATEHDWRWALKDESGTDAHKTFWYALVSWLGTGGEERIRADSSNQVHDISQPINLDIELLGANYEPADNALVEAVLVDSKGKKQRIQLFPSSNQPGNYKAAFTPSSTGDYKIKYTCTFPNSDPLEHEAFFGVGSNGGETQDVVFEEGLLQDLARLTRGEYRHYSRMNTTDWNLSKSLPQAETRISLTDNLFFLCLLAGLIGSEWIFRRQSGLR